MNSFEQQLNQVKVSDSILKRWSLRSINENTIEGVDFNIVILDGVLNFYFPEGDFVGRAVSVAEEIAEDLDIRIQYTLRGKDIDSEIVTTSTQIAMPRRLIEEEYNLGPFSEFPKDKDEDDEDENDREKVKEILLRELDNLNSLQISYALAILSNIFESISDENKLNKILERLGVDDEIKLRMKAAVRECFDVLNNPEYAILHLKLCANDKIRRLMFHFSKRSQKVVYEVYESSLRHPSSNDVVLKKLGKFVAQPIKEFILNDRYDNLSYMHPHDFWNALLNRSEYKDIDIISVMTTLVDAPSWALPGFIDFAFANPFEATAGGMFCAVIKDFKYLPLLAEFFNQNYEFLTSKISLIFKLVLLGAEESSKMWDLTKELTYSKEGIDRFFSNFSRGDNSGLNLIYKQGNDEILQHFLPSLDETKQEFMYKMILVLAEIWDYGFLDNVNLSAHLQYSFLRLLVCADELNLMENPKVAGFMLYMRDRMLECIADFTRGFSSEVGTLKDMREHHTYSILHDDDFWHKLESIAPSRRIVLGNNIRNKRAMENGNTMSKFLPPHKQNFDLNVRHINENKIRLRSSTLLEESYKLLLNSDEDSAIQEAYDRRALRMQGIKNARMNIKSLGAKADLHLEIFEVDIANQEQINKIAAGIRTILIWFLKLRKNTQKSVVGKHIPEAEFSISDEEFELLAIKLTRNPRIGWLASLMNEDSSQIFLSEVTREPAKFFYLIKLMLYVLLPEASSFSFSNSKASQALEVELQKFEHLSSLNNSLITLAKDLIDPNSSEPNILQAIYTSIEEVAHSGENFKAYIDQNVYELYLQRNREIEFMGETFFIPNVIATADIPYYVMYLSHKMGMKEFSDKLYEMLKPYEINEKVEEKLEFNRIENQKRPITVENIKKDSFMDYGSVEWDNIGTIWSLPYAIIESDLPKLEFCDVDIMVGNTFYNKDAIEDLKKRNTVGYYTDCKKNIIYPSNLANRIVGIFYEDMSQRVQNVGTLKWDTYGRIILPDSIKNLGKKILVVEEPIEQFDLGRERGRIVRLNPNEKINFFTQARIYELPNFREYNELANLHGLIKKAVDSNASPDKIEGYCTLALRLLEDLSIYKRKYGINFIFKVSLNGRPFVKLLNEVLNHPELGIDCSDICALIAGYFRSAGIKVDFIYENAGFVNNEKKIQYRQSFGHAKCFIAERILVDLTPREIEDQDLKEALEKPIQNNTNSQMSPTDLIINAALDSSTSDSSKRQHSTIEENSGINAFMQRVLKELNIENPEDMTTEDMVEILTKICERKTNHLDSESGVSEENMLDPFAVDLAKIQLLLYSYDNFFLDYKLSQKYINAVIDILDGYSENITREAIEYVGSSLYFYFEYVRDFDELERLLTPGVLRELMPNMFNNEFVQNSDGILSAIAAIAFLYYRFRKLFENPKFKPQLAYWLNGRELPALDISNDETMRSVIERSAESRIRNGFNRYKATVDKNLFPLMIKKNKPLTTYIKLLESQRVMEAQLGIAYSET